jgi:hypothetical protein
LLTRPTSRRPCSTAFIVSTGDGDGFGSILCVEESCYQDIVLGRSPELADGGRSRGFGSFDAFAVRLPRPFPSAALLSHQHASRGRIARVECTRVFSPAARKRVSGSLARTRRARRKGAHAQAAAPP